jgi:hypothetical protein
MRRNQPLEQMQRIGALSAQQTLAHPATNSRFQPKASKNGALIKICLSVRQTFGDCPAMSPDPKTDLIFQL